MWTVLEVFMTTVRTCQVASGSEDDDLDRYIEIWNLCSCSSTAMPRRVYPLPAPSVDTGMGLERIAAVLQHDSNYEIDLFTALIAMWRSNITNTEDKSLRVIADHLRSTAFLIADGVLPGNEGRGYVLRRIIRRAIRHGNKLGAKEAFFAALVPDLLAQMGEATTTGGAAGSHYRCLAGRGRPIRSYVG